MLYINQKGNVGYVIVGSPAIVDGILQNPNRQNYIKTDTTFQDTGEDFRLHVEFVRTSSGSVPVLGTNQTGGARPLLALDASKPRFRIGTGVNIYGVQSLWRTNTPYAIDVSRTGNIWTLKSFMNGNQVDIQTLESSALLNDGAAFTWVFGCDFAVYGGGIEGNIDINKTYINYDKEAWFGVSPMEVKKHQIMGPNGYTVVGSPTISDGVLTDITANDYLSIGTYSGDTPTSIEIGSSFKTSDATVLGRAVIGRLTGADTGIFWGNSSFPGRICFKHRVSYDNGTTWTAVESKSAALSLNTRYYVKFIISLAEQKLTGYVSTDNTNWTSYVANFNSGAILEGLTSIAIGKIFGHNPSTLPIYLDYTYIKVNGKLWFWQPQETKRIVVNGVEVWTKPE